MVCDLRTAPVFPVLLNGQVTPVALWELLMNAHEITDLAVAIPPAAAGMLRVLYIITARITGLDKVSLSDGDKATMVDQWAAKRREVLSSRKFDPKKVDKYLSADGNQWNLFDEVRPWMQDPRLAVEAERKPANVLDLTRPGDNTPIWWRHTHTGNAPEIPVAEALQWLLVHHCYGSGGAGGIRRVNGTGDQYMSAGPLRSTVSFYPLGTNLFDTLVAGVPSPSTVEDPTAPDAAPWETDAQHDPLSNPPAATWPAGLLVGQSRHALLLVPNTTSTAVVGGYLTWGWKPKHPVVADPYTIQDRRTDGTWIPRAASADRAVWRDVDALLAERATHQRPTVLTGTLTLPDQLQDLLRVRVIGFDQDRKATNEAWITATTPPVIRYLDEHDPQRAAGAEALHQAAEDIAGVMRTALRTAYRALGTGNAGRDKNKAVPWIAPAEHHYWPHAEQLFWQRLRGGVFDEPYRAFLTIALDAVEAATQHEEHHPAVAREITNAVRFLRNFAAKKNPRPPKEKPSGQ